MRWTIVGGAPRLLSRRGRPTGPPANQGTAFPCGAQSGGPPTGAWCEEHRSGDHRSPTGSHAPRVRRPGCRTPRRWMVSARSSPRDNRAVPAPRRAAYETPPHQIVHRNVNIYRRALTRTYNGRQDGEAHLRTGTSPGASPAPRNWYQDVPKHSGSDLPTYGHRPSVHGPVAVLP